MDHDDLRPRPNGQGLRRLRNGVVLLVSGGALAWLLMAFDMSALRASAHSVSPHVWLLTACGLLLSYGLRALRLHGEWRERLRFTDCLHLMLSHNAAVNLLPLRAGEAGYAWLLHRRFGVPVTESVVSLFWLRLQDAIVLSVLAAGLLLPMPWATAGAGLALGLWGAVLAWGFRYLERLPAPDAGRTRRAWIPRVSQALVTLRHQRGTWLYCGANWIVKLGAIGGLLMALTESSVPEGLRGALGGELAALMPAQAPAGLGGYEAGVWLGLRIGTTLAADTPRLIAAALAAHAFSLAVSLAAAAVAWLALPFLKSGETSCTTTTS